MEKEALVLGVKKPQRRTFNQQHPSYQELLDIATGKAPEAGWMGQDKGGVACGQVNECRCTD